jgi:hypothetical protein
VAAIGVNDSAFFGRGDLQDSFAKLLGGAIHLVIGRDLR